MTDLPKLNPIKVVKFTGDRKSAMTSTGKVVYRQDKLWMGKEFGWVICPSTGPHFIYHDPDMNQQTGEWPKGKKFLGRWSPLCSCGGFALIVGYGAYSQFQSPTRGSSTPGQMLMCEALLTTGHHLDGSHD